MSTYGDFWMAVKNCYQHSCGTDWCCWRRVELLQGKKHPESKVKCSTSSPQRELIWIPALVEIIFGVKNIMRSIPRKAICEADNIDKETVLKQILDGLKKTWFRYGGFKAVCTVIRLLITNPGNAFSWYWWPPRLHLLPIYMDVHNCWFAQPGLLQQD